MLQLLALQVQLTGQPTRQAVAAGTAGKQGKAKQGSCLQERWMKMC